MKALWQILEVTYSPRAEKEVMPKLEGVVVRGVTKKTIQLRLEIADARFVSPDILAPCYLTVALKQGGFRDPLRDELVEDVLIEPVDLPRLFEGGAGDSDALLADAVEAAADAEATLLSASLLLDVALGTSLKFLWAMVNTLQMICYFDRIRLSFSPLALAFLKTLRRTALGEFIPWDRITEMTRDGYEEEENAAKKVAIAAAATVALLLVVSITAWLIIEKYGYERKVKRMLR